MKLELKRSEIPAHLLKYFKSVDYKPKDEIDVPNMLCEALRRDGWFRRSTIIWSKPNPMPESVTDRPTKAHEYLFLLSKCAKYYYSADAIREPHSERALRDVGRAKVENIHGTKYDGHPTSASGRYGGETYRACVEKNGGVAGHPAGRNKRSVWTVSTQSFSGAHFATFPPKLIEPCILAGSRPGDTILDPFGGSGTSAMVARELGRKAILCELNPDYVEIMKQRLNADQTTIFEALAAA